MFKPCVLIPTYNNPQTITSVVDEVSQYLTDILVVDDGSEPEARAVCQALEKGGRAQVCYRRRNGGKGAAVKTGLELAQSLGFTHALQVDADGQHDLRQIQSFLDLGAENEECCVIAYPEYDESAPRIRRIARKFTQLWIDLEVGKGVIRDGMVGFRLYPIQAVLDAGVLGNRMDFDVEVVVRLAWRKVPILNRPVAVCYPSREDGGISHFQPLRDNMRFAWLHSRLCMEAIRQWVTGPIRRRITQGGRS